MLAGRKTRSRHANSEDVGLDEQAEETESNQDDVEDSGLVNFTDLSVYYWHVSEKIIVAASQD